MTAYAGPLLPCFIATTGGHAAPRQEVQVIYGSTRQPAPIYLDRDRTPAPLPIVSDEFGNLSDYYAEPGFYTILGEGLAEVDTLATMDPEEAITASSTPGPTGAPGAPGPAGENAPKRFTGHGPPGVVMGASPQDEYLDVDSGNLYTLT